jgi:YajG family uncharacterized lipoprotein
VKRPLLQTAFFFGLAASVAVIAGCAGKGEVRYLDLHTKPPVAQPGGMESVIIAIEPFEDRRMDKNRVGMRSHLWGGMTYFNVSGEQPGQLIAQALADRLKARGWRDRAWNVRVVPAGSATDADIVVTGQVHQFSANAKSRVFSTAIITNSKVTVQARNQADKSTTIRSVEGSQSRTVFWFDEDDVQELLAATLRDDIDRLIADTTIDQRSLRPAP